MIRSQQNSSLVVFLFSLFSVAAAVTAAGQEKAPKIFAPYLEANQIYKAERVVVVPPKEIDQYIKLVKEGADQNPEWYAEYSKKAKPGVPLPFHENLNLTPEQYKEYRALWDKREFKSLEEMAIRLEKAGDQWRFMISGSGARVALLRYDEKTDTFKSTNGTLKRIDDIEAAPETILGEWKGVEWRYEEETGLGKTKENFAIGKSSDGKFGFLIYRLQDITTTNKMLFDQSLVIRFLLK